MGVVRFVQELSAVETAADVRSPVADLAIEPVVMPRDRAAVLSLADEAREGTVSFAGRGLLAELESRDGRHISAWLAWRSATLGPRPIGIVMVAETDAGLSIPWLLVDPDVRRQGVARTLVDAAVRHARSVNAPRITADTLDSWVESRAFWPAVGFTLAGTVDPD
jgi:GNAT superfamily N-acetyltransferase